MVGEGESIQLGLGNSSVRTTKEYKGRVTWKRAGKRQCEEIHNKTCVRKSLRVQRGIRGVFFEKGLRGGGTASAIGNSVRATEGGRNRVRDVNWEYHLAAPAPPPPPPAMVHCRQQGQVPGWGGGRGDVSYFPRGAVQSFCRLGIFIFNLGSLVSELNCIYIIKFNIYINLSPQPPPRRPGTNPGTSDVGVLPPPNP